MKINKNKKEKLKKRLETLKEKSGKKKIWSLEVLKVLNLDRCRNEF
jgi:hypothetical protein